MSVYGTDSNDDITPQKAMVLPSVVFCRNVTPAVGKELMCVHIHTCLYICTNQSIWH